MHACKRSNPTGRSGQLRSGFRACGPTLQRQNTHDDLQTIRKAMLELLGQRVVTLQEVGFLTKPYLLPRASRLQFRVIASYCVCRRASRSTARLPGNRNTVPWTYMESLIVPPPCAHEVEDRLLGQIRNWLVDQAVSCDAMLYRHRSPNCSKLLTCGELRKRYEMSYGLASDGQLQRGKARTAAAAERQRRNGAPQMGVLIPGFPSASQRPGWS
jgi:hypothetical protein